MVDRDYIIKRIQSRSLTPGEFDFDRLQCPPLTSLLTPFDIESIEQIAYSIRLSAQLKKKYELIDNILRPRGFRKFINGTNRMCYEYIEDKSFMLKVAYNSVGAKDSPWEFKNQFLFKPFVPKIFEVSRKGVIALNERVTPITNQEEFRAVAEDIYTVINEVFVGEYVLADIGTKYFMNWGIREGFGPVLLDFPYVYKLDGKKLFCNRADPTSETGYCNGQIDYDPGYNFLVCTKCGKRYKAADLRQTGISRQIIVRGDKGGYKMKVSVRGGNKEVSRTIQVGEDGKYVEVTKTPVSTKEKAVKSEPKIEEVKVEEKKVEEPVKEKVVTKEVTVPAKTVSASAKIANTEVNANAKSMTEEVMKKAIEEEDRSGAISPIKFFTEEEKMKAMDTILNHINQIRSLSGMLTDEESIDLGEMFIDLMIEFENRPNRVNYSLHSYLKTAEKCALLLDKLSPEDKAEAVENGFTKEIADAWNEAHPVEKEEITEEPVEEEELLEDEVAEAADDEEDSEYSLDAEGFAMVNASVQNVKDIDHSLNPKKVLVLVDDEDNFILTGDRRIMAIDTINNRSVDSLSIVSAEWVAQATAIINAKDSNDDAEDAVDDEIIDTVDGENSEE